MWILDRLSESNPDWVAAPVPRVGVDPTPLQLAHVCVEVDPPVGDPHVRAITAHHSIGVALVNNLLAGIARDVAAQLLGDRRIRVEYDRLDGSQILVGVQHDLSLLRKRDELERELVLHIPRLKVEDLGGPELRTLAHGEPDARESLGFELLVRPDGKLPAEHGALCPVHASLDCFFDMDLPVVHGHPLPGLEGSYDILAGRLPE